MCDMPCYGYITYACMPVLLYYMLLVDHVVYPLFGFVEDSLIFCALRNQDFHIEVDYSIYLYF